MNKQSQQAIAQQHLENQLSSLRTSLVVEVTRLSADASAQVERGLRRVVDVAQQIEEAVKALPAAIVAAQPKPAPPPQCKSCRHAKPAHFFPFVPNWEFAKCGFPRDDDARTLVDGRSSTTYCESARKSYGHCGPSGNHWERKA